jgi:hypothetical protein
MGDTAEICPSWYRAALWPEVRTLRYKQYGGEVTVKLDIGQVFQPNGRYLLRYGKFRL